MEVRLTFVLVVAAIAACGGDDGDSSRDANQADTAIVSDAGPPADAFFVDPTTCDDEGIMQSAVFIGGGCTTGPCHDSSTPASGLDLRLPDVGTRLIGVTTPTPNCTPTTYVTPADPAASLIYRMTTPTAPCGSRMPLGRAPISTAQSDCLQFWINSL